MTRVDELALEDGLAGELGHSTKTDSGELGAGQIEVHRAFSSIPQAGDCGPGSSLTTNSRLRAQGLGAGGLVVVATAQRRRREEE